MSYRGPKAKLSRRLGVPLTTKAAAVMLRKPHAPGEHGQRRRRSPSDFGIQLLEKQRLRCQYNVSEKQLRRYFAQAKRRKENTADALVKILESRLDNVVLRAGYATSIYQARQLVSHGHFEVNGKRVNIPSYVVGLSDVITIRDKSKKLMLFQEAISKATVPAYIESDHQNMTTRLAREPEASEVPIQCETQLVVEFYSR